MLLVYAVSSLKDSKYQDTLLSLLTTTVIDSSIHVFLFLAMELSALKHSICLPIAWRLDSCGVSKSSSSDEPSLHKKFATACALLLLFAFVVGSALATVIFCKFF